MTGRADRVEVNFNQFFAAEYPALVALLDRMCSSEDEAEDLAQEVMSRACERWSEIALHPNPAAWVRRVALNLAMSGHRRTRRGAAARLRIRAAVVLHYLEDRPVAEIADLLGCAPATARVHLYRGRQALYAALGSMLNEEEGP